MFPLRGAREECLKDNQTNAIDRKKLLRLVSGRFLCVRTKIIFYLLSFPDVLNANGSTSYYSPLKAGSPAPLHNPLVSGERGEITVGPLWANIYTLVVYAVRESHSVL